MVGGVVAELLREEEGSTADALGVALLVAATADAVAMARPTVMLPSINAERDVG